MTQDNETPTLTLLDRLRGIRRQKVESAKTAYSRLLKRQFAGLPVDAAEFLAVMDAAGVSESDLREHLELLRRHAELEALAVKAEVTKQQLAAAQAEHDAHVENVWKPAESKRAALCARLADLQSEAQFSVLNGTDQLPGFRERAAVLLGNAI